MLFTATAPTDGMSNYVAIDPSEHRVLIRATGQWTPADAIAYHGRMLDILALTERTRRPITILADMQGLCIHTADVARILEDSVAVMARFPIGGYALVVPSYLMRMQARRLLAALGCRYELSENLTAARVWLGWERSYSLAA
jgi:hypothetical protein